MKMETDGNIREMAGIFKAAGHSLYLVGGAVRDYLLGRENDDWDFTTDATPMEVKALFRRTIDTGIKHGTVTVLFKGGSYEITTFRTEGDYSDGRHPDSVTFVRSLEEDLRRRDFTINAFAAALPSGEIVDLHGGMEDLERGTIRAIGNAEERFGEDALRMLRAFRFSSKLGFEIEEGTLDAVRKLKGNIRNVSSERVREELWKTLSSPYPGKGLRKMEETGLLYEILPEVAALDGLWQGGYHSEDAFEHTILALENVKAMGGSTSVLVAALLHDIGKAVTVRPGDGRNTFIGHEIKGAEMAEDIMRRLKASNTEREEVVLLVREHMIHYTPDWTDGAVRRFIARVGENNLSSLFLLHAADIKATLNYTKEDLTPLLAERVRMELERKAPLSVKDLAINGSDLAKVVEKGPLMGKILKALLDKVMDDPSLNEKETLMGLAESILEASPCP